MNKASVRIICAFLLIVGAVVALVEAVSDASEVQLLGNYHYSTDGTDLGAWYSGWATALFTLSGVAVLAAAVLLAWPAIRRSAKRQPVQVTQPTA